MRQPSFQISFKETNQYFPLILLVGLALGTANYALGTWPSLGQSIVQQTSISIVIGYGLVLIGFNAPKWFPAGVSSYKKYGILILLFSILGIIGSETQMMVKSLLFQQGSYWPFQYNGDKLFNVILSSVLGFQTLSWAGLKLKQANKTETAPPPQPELSQELAVQEETSPTPLDTIPIRKGEVITLFATNEVAFFEAYDNYAFLHALDGEKHLINYSLSFLEKRLADHFIRVHRKYLINKNQIAQITPHLKGRYVITFKDKGKKTITTSNSYTATIKSLIRL